MTINLDIIKTKLCKAIDSEGKVLENKIVLDIITQLHTLDITTEELERTRLGKFVNLIRKNTTEPDIANKARALVKKWQKLVIGARPEIANGFKGNSKKQRISRESTPQRENTPQRDEPHREASMGPRADTPSYDTDSRESTPMLTNGHTDTSPLTSNEHGVQYKDTSYSWTQAIPVQHEQQSDNQPPKYVILPYVCLE